MNKVNQMVFQPIFADNFAKSIGDCGQYGW